MAELEIANVRELEDFLINECIFVVSLLHSWALLEPLVIMLTSYWPP